MQRKYDEVGDEEEDDEDGQGEDERKDAGPVKFYVVCFLFSFVVLFSIFSLILWAASLAYKPRIIVKVSPSLIFEVFRFSFSFFLFFPLFFECLLV